MNPLFLVLIIACWLGIIGLSIVLPFKPAVLKITEKLVCPQGSQMVIDSTEFKSAGRVNRTLNVYCQEEGSTTQHSITFQSIAVLWGIFFLAALPPSAILVMLINLWSKGTFLNP